MALRTKSAIKKNRQNIKKRERNKNVITNLRGKIRNYLNAIEEKDLEKSKKILADLVSSIDRAASKGVIHKRNASRRISRFSRKLSDLANSSTENS